MPHFLLCALRLNCRCPMKGTCMITENYSIENNSRFYNDVNRKAKLRLEKQMYSLKNYCEHMVN